MRRIVFIAALVFTGTAAAQSTHGVRADAPAPGTLFLYPERVPQRDGSLATAERGMLFVPVNRADTAAGVIGVDLWRFRAAEPTPLPPIVLLHGGPGWPGLDASLENFDYWDQVIAMFTGVTDLVVIGQRGIGSSKPNTLCDGRGFPNAASRTCRAYWEKQGLDLSGFTVLEAAADVRDAVHALGYDSIIVWGGSFGSHWGMAVIRTYPELVARAVLRGMEGPDHTYDSPTGVWNAIKRYAAEAEQSTDVRALFPGGSIIAAIDSIRTRLSQGVVRASAPHPETGDVETMTFNVFQLPGLIDGYTSSIASPAKRRVGRPTSTVSIEGTSHPWSRRDSRRPHRHPQSARTGRRATSCSIAARASRERGSSVTRAIPPFHTSAIAPPSTKRPARRGTAISAMASVRSSTRTSPRRSSTATGT